jgi:hypothetical protein
VNQFTPIDGTTQADPRGMSASNASPYSKGVIQNV